MTGIRDLARHLGLSIGTVSRALNDRGDVNPLTRQRVREAAAKLGYSPNQSGRSLRRGKTDLIAMIVPSGRDDTLINTVFLSVLDGLRRRLGEHGLDLAVFLEDGERGPRLARSARVTERGIADALIIADTESADPRVEYLIKLRKPFVTFGRTRAPARHAWVDPDFEQAVEAGIGRLVALGHRRIGLVLPDRPMHYLGLVETAYRRALPTAGFPSIRAGTCGGRRASGAATKPPTRSCPGTSRRPLRSSPIPCMRLRSIATLSERGLRPGRDLSILALLPEARAQYLIPTLTTCQTDWTAIGERLADAVQVELLLAEGEPGPDRAPPSRVQALAPVALTSGESVSRVQDFEAAAARGVP